MATPATRLKFEVLRTIQRHTISRFTIPSVPAASSSIVYSLDVAIAEGILQGFRVHCATGTDYTIAVRATEIGADYSVFEILRVEEIDTKGYQEMLLGIAYSNDDNVDITPNLESEIVDSQNWISAANENKLLYFQVHNIGATPTGVLTFELVIEDAS